MRAGANRCRTDHDPCRASTSLLLTADPAPWRGGALALSLSAADNLACEEDATLLRLHEALAALAQQDARRSQVLELTYFGGLSREDVARALEVSVPTVDRDLRFGRAWVKQAMDGD